MFKRLFHILITLVLTCLSASAQFYVTGDDPGKLKWSYIESDHFRIIYPTGSDSLAKAYGIDLEKYRIPLSRTSGYLGSGGFGKKMPVVLHTHNGANGSVAWAPKRMDLFTLPTAYDPEPIPWSRMLSIHEGRHVTQMQFGMTKALKPGNWFFGEMWNIATTVFFARIAYMEGDAVIAETAYTPSGRGRTADFLNYYRVAFEQGHNRKFYQWRFDSQKNFSPSYYALGYLGLGGIRYLYDKPDIMAKGLDYAARRPYNLVAFNTAIKKETGRSINTAFNEICDTLTTIWKKDSESRAPFIPSESVTKSPKLYTEYSNSIFVGNDLYAIKKGHLTTPVLVKIDPLLKETFVSRFASEASTLKKDEEENIYWSESKQDPRWSLKTVSTIQKLEPGKKNSHKVGKKGFIYNPVISPDNYKIALTEYSVHGGSAIQLRENTTDSKSLATFQAPDSLQLVESVWLEDNLIYSTAVSNNGYGIYCLNLSTDEWETTLSPQPVMIKDFKGYESGLMFTCDRTGVNELYHFDPVSKQLTQKTSTHFGAEDFVYSPEGYYLYYTSPTIKGKQIYRTHVDSLINRSVDFTDLYKYPIAEKITEQEKALAAQKEVSFTSDSTINFSEPAKYNKFKHAFNIHSWAPLYVSVNNIMNMSYDRTYEAASLGLTGILQNRLATAVGEIGFSVHKDPYEVNKWRHSGHVKFTYSGWYPVFEIALDYNDRSARQFHVTAYTYEGQTGVGIDNKILNTPYFQGKISTYIPFNLSSGGWYRGVIPRLSYTITNDMFNENISVLSYDPNMGYFDKEPVFVGSIDGKNSLRQYMSGSIRAYSVLGTPNSAVYPKWGIGIEAGATGSIGLQKFISPMGYIYGYGYIPGFVPQQGLKLSAMYQRKLSPKAYFGQPTVNMVPRGLKNNANLMNYLSIYNDNLTNFSADYAIPVYIGDLSIGGSLLYIKRMVITPHFDFNLVEATPKLFSVGASLTFDLESILFLTWPCSVGVTYSYNGGFNNSINEFNETGIEIGHHFVGPVFNVSF